MQRGGRVSRSTRRRWRRWRLGMVVAMVGASGGGMGDGQRRRLPMPVLRNVPRRQVFTATMIGKYLPLPLLVLGGIFK